MIAAREFRRLRSSPKLLDSSNGRVAIILLNSLSNCSQSVKRSDFVHPESAQRVRGLQYQSWLRLRKLKRAVSRTAIHIDGCLCCFRVPEMGNVVDIEYEGRLKAVEWPT